MRHQGGEPVRLRARHRQALVHMHVLHEAQHLAVRVPLVDDALCQPQRVIIVGLQRLCGVV